MSAEYPTSETGPLKFADIVGLNHNYPSPEAFHGRQEEIYRYLAPDDTTLPDLTPVERERVLASLEIELHYIYFKRGLTGALKETESHVLTQLSKWKTESPEIHAWITSGEQGEPVKDMIRGKILYTYNLHKKSPKKQDIIVDRSLT